MKPFRATYTPWDLASANPDKNKARIVLIMAILPTDADHIPDATFIDNDNSLKSDGINRFTDCQSTEWR